MIKNPKKIKIAIGYAPIESTKGTPLLSQNRQFQFFSSPTYIYPIIPASAATLLRQAGYSVFWLDGIAQKKTLPQWMGMLKRIRPTMLIIETKTPVIQTHWEQMRRIKQILPRIKIVLVGDHVSYLPYESFEKSRVDYVITGGDYDFGLLNLCNHLFKNDALEGGIYWRKGDSRVHAKPTRSHPIRNGIVFSSGPAQLTHQLDSLPFIDRKLTKWELYAYENGNYKYTPGTYVYSGRDCWWGRCTFCVWNYTLNPLGTYRSFSPERLFEEVKYLVDTYKVKEIFDDSGTFYVGLKLRKFCNLLIQSGYCRKVRFGCNMRFGVLKKEDYLLMSKAGFRFLLVGVESANKKTLERIKKGITRQDILKGAKAASEANLEVHATIMLGYPWESYREARKTVEFAKYCFKKGYFYTLQSTIVVPYPGTPLYEDAKSNDLLLTKDYRRYDMGEPVMKIPYSNEALYALIKETYTSFLTPQYIWKVITRIRNLNDVMYLWVGAKKLMGHLTDFSR